MRYEERAGGSGEVGQTMRLAGADQVRSAVVEHTEPESDDDRRDRLHQSRRERLIGEVDQVKHAEHHGADVGPSA